MATVSLTHLSVSLLYHSSFSLLCTLSSTTPNVEAIQFFHFIFHKYSLLSKLDCFVFLSSLCALAIYEVRLWYAHVILMMASFVLKCTYFWRDYPLPLFLVLCSLECSLSWLGWNKFVYLSVVYWVSGHTFHC